MGNSLEHKHFNISWPWWTVGKVVGEEGADLGELLEVDGGTQGRMTMRWWHARKEGSTRGRRVVRWWCVREARECGMRNEAATRGRKATWGMRPPREGGGRRAREESSARDKGGTWGRREAREGGGRWDVGSVREEGGQMIMPGLGFKGRPLT
jgi:hypothetical protein